MTIEINRIKYGEHTLTLLPAVALSLSKNGRIQGQRMRASADDALDAQDRLEAYYMEYGPEFTADATFVSHILYGDKL